MNSDSHNVSIDGSLELARETTGDSIHLGNFDIGMTGAAIFAVSLHFSIWIV